MSFLNFFTPLNEHDSQLVDIHTLAKEGNTSKLFAELNVHPNRVNEKDEFGDTLLQIACCWDRMDTAIMLIESGTVVISEEISFHPLQLRSWKCDRYLISGIMTVDDTSLVPISTSIDRQQHLLNIAFLS
jgi:hypothetical protein